MATVKVAGKVAMVAVVRVEVARVEVAMVAVVRREVARSEGEVVRIR